MASKNSSYLSNNFFNKENIPSFSMFAASNSNYPNGSGAAAAFGLHQSSLMSHQQQLLQPAAYMAIKSMNASALNPTMGSSSCNMQASTSNYPNTRKFGRELSNYQQQQLQQPANSSITYSHNPQFQHVKSSNAAQMYVSTNSRCTSRDLSAGNRRQTSFITGNNNNGRLNSSGNSSMLENNSRLRSNQGGRINGVSAVGATSTVNSLAQTLNSQSSNAKMDLEGFYSSTMNTSQSQQQSQQYESVNQFAYAPVAAATSIGAATSSLTQRYNNFTCNAPAPIIIPIDENCNGVESSYSTIPVQSVYTSQERAPVVVMDASGDEDYKEIPVEPIDQRYLHRPEYVPQYAKEIFDYLRANEERYICKTAYFETDRQPDLNSRMRTILIDWLVDVHLKFDLLPETLFLTVNLIDRYLEQGPRIEKSKFQLVGIAALFIACKYEEIYPPVVNDFTYVCDNAYTKQELFEQEGSILTALNFNITTPSAYRFLERYARVAEFDQKCFLTALYFLEMSLVDYAGIRCTPSAVACSAILIANVIHGRKDKWSEAMVRNTKYEYAEIVGVVEEVCEMHRKAEAREKSTQDKEKQLNAVKRKYSQPRFESVHATIVGFFQQAAKTMVPQTVVVEEQ